MLNQLMTNLLKLSLLSKRCHNQFVRCECANPIAVPFIIDASYYTKPPLDISGVGTIALLQCDIGCQHQEYGFADIPPEVDVEPDGRVSPGSRHTNELRVTSLVANQPSRPKKSR
jgi:hypothetical protein